MTGRPRGILHRDIAHSAGSWTARAAMKRLLELNPYVVAQLTLLDPFMPGGGSELNTALMSGAASLYGNDRMQRLENYYVQPTAARSFIAQ